MNNNKIESVLIALRRLIRATDLYSRGLVKSTGLTTPQLLLLLSIKNKGEVSIRELALEISLSQATVTSILDRLESKKLVIRKRSTKDKRIVHAYLTASGKKIIAKAPPPLQDSFIKAFEHLEDWEQNMIIASLQRVASMMDAQDIDAAPVLDVGALDRQSFPAQNGENVESLESLENKR